MRSGSKRELEQVEQDRDKLRLGDPYILDISHNDKIFDPLAKSVRHTPTTNTAQAASDWRRNKDFYFIDGKSVDTIITEMKAKKLQLAVEEYLAADKPENLAAWQQFISSDANTQIDFELAKKIIADAEDKLFANKGKIECLNALPNENAAMKTLIETIVKPIAILFENTTAPESTSFLEEMWRTYLLQHTPTVERQNEFIKVLFEYGHQGGVLHALSTAIASRVMLSQVEAPDSIQEVVSGVPVMVNPAYTHRISSESLMQNCTVNVSFADDKVIIHESSPISIFTARKDVELLDSVHDINHPMPYTNYKGDVKYKNMFLIEPEAIHSIALDENKQAKITQVLLRENIYSDRVLPTLSHVYMQDIRDDVQKYFNLVDYANAYIEEGSHNDKMADDLIKKYPEIVKADSVKKDYFSFHTSASKKGDKILNYLGEQYPSYFNNIIARQHEYFGNEKTFTFYIKLLVRLGNHDFQQGHNADAIALLKSYLDKANVEIKMPDGLLKEPLIKEIYINLNKNNFFTQFPPPPARNIFAEEKSIFPDATVVAKMNDVLNKFLKPNHSSSSDIRIMSSIIFTSPQVQERRAASALLRSLEKSSGSSMAIFKAKTFLYCILTYGNKFPELNEAVRREFPSLTVDGLRTELSNELKFHGNQYEFGELNSTVIKPLVHTLLRMTEHQMKNPLDDINKSIERFNGPQTRHHFTPYHAPF